jgi:AraC-like DNA-binding protein
MLEKMHITEPRLTDMNMYSCGIEDCKSGYFWGPAVRDHYIIHYVLGGQGTYTVNGVTYNLRENDGFLICPNTIVYYQADIERPWSYGWVGFNGFKALTYLKQAGLDNDNPVFRYECDDFLRNKLMEMIGTKQLSRGKEIRLLGLLYEFLSQLVETAQTDLNEGSNNKEAYVKKALEYISMNYSRKISVSQIAKSVGLDRSYLYSLFMEYLKTSPQEYLINFRIEKSCELMHANLLSIGDIARSVGYDDPLTFSKVFRKLKGVSPSKFRSSLQTVSN